MIFISKFVLLYLLRSILKGTFFGFFLTLCLLLAEGWLPNSSVEDWCLLGPLCQPATVVPSQQPLSLAPPLKPGWPAWPESPLGTMPSLPLLGVPSMGQIWGLVQEGFALPLLRGLRWAAWGSFTFFLSAHPSFQLPYLCHFFIRHN